MGQKGVSEAGQHAATINSMIFIFAFLAIVVTGELLEAHTRLYRCAVLMGIVAIAAAAMRPTTPAAQTADARGSTSLASAAG